MFKLIIILSMIIPFFNANIVNQIKDVYPLSYNFETDFVSIEDVEKSIVAIVNRDQRNIASGIIFDIDNSGIYIMTSTYNILEYDYYEVVFDNFLKLRGYIVGYSLKHEIAIMKTEYIETSTIKEMIYTNSDLLTEGEYLRSLSRSIYNDFKIIETSGITSRKGVYFENKTKESYFTNVGTFSSNTYAFGGGVYNLYNQLVGINTSKTFYSRDSSIENSSNFIDINQAMLISEKIKKYGEYKENELPFDIINLYELDSEDKEFYNIHFSATEGVVVKTFKPLKYVFGGLNQGMVIKKINGVKIKNSYELHKQLLRYNYDCFVELEVLKNNGKTVYYRVQV